VKGLLRKILAFLWPAVGLRKASKYIDNDLDNFLKRWEKSYNEQGKKFKRCSPEKLDSIRKRTCEIYEDEMRREVTIEGKARTSIGTVGIVVSILTFSIVTSDQLVSLIPWCRYLTISLLGLSILYLFVCVWFSVKALEYRSSFVDRMDNVSESLERSKKDFVIDEILSKLLSTEANYKKNTHKVNYSWLANGFFIRGIILLALTIVSFFIAKIIN